MSKFTVQTKAVRAEGDYAITRIDTVAEKFLWYKVEIDGKLLGKHNDYVTALAKLKPAEYKEACELATKLNKEAHDRRLAKAKASGQSLSRGW
jgi:hypothetical protein